jgi:hypothetical protein
MKLEINQTIVAEDADADDIKDALRVLSPEDEAFITLWESEGVFLQAAGVPRTGFVMGYHNAQTGEELTSKNKALKQPAVTRALTSYARGSAEWRNTIGWQPTGEYAARSIGTGAALRRAWPFYAGILFFCVAIVPLVMGTKAVMDQTVYKPLCEQDSERQFDHFSHGSGNGNIPYSPARCWYANGENIALEDIMESGSLVVDVAGRIIQVVVPIILIVVIEGVGLMLWWRGRKRGMTARVSGSISE